MKINSKFALRKIGDTFYLQSFDEQTQQELQMIFLNETSVFLWEHLGECNLYGELVQLLMQEYEVDEEQAKTDVIAFLQFLEKQGCLMPGEMSEIADI